MGTESLPTEVEGGAPPVGEPIRVRRALISVSDKTGVSDFAAGLAELGIEIVSTGGTADALGEAGIKVRTVEELTGSAEILDGRVKTLHPRLHAALLAVRDDAAHVKTLEDEGIETIDLVCVNLYPFERTVARLNVSEDEALENIDIGGPTMIRAAAKNHRYVAVVVEPESYDAVLEEPACVIVKHNNPSGVAIAEGPAEAYEKALACDPMSAYGGVVALNREVADGLARRLHENFIEVLIAPAYR